MTVFDTSQSLLALGLFNPQAVCIEGVQDRTCLNYALYREVRRQLTLPDPLSCPVSGLVLSRARRGPQPPPKSETPKAFNTSSFRRTCSVFFRSIVSRAISRRWRSSLRFALASRVRTAISSRSASRTAHCAGSSPIGSLTSMAAAPTSDKNLSRSSSIFTMRNFRDCWLCNVLFSSDSRSSTFPMFAGEAVPSSQVPLSASANRISHSSSRRSAASTARRLDARSSSLACTVFAASACAASSLICLSRKSSAAAAVVSRLSLGLLTGCRRSPVHRSILKFN